MYKLDYNDKLLDLVFDVSMFKLCDSKHSDRIKVKINKIAIKIYERYTPLIFIKFDVMVTATTDICTDSPKCTKAKTTPH